MTRCRRVVSELAGFVLFNSMNCWYLAAAGDSAISVSYKQRLYIAILVADIDWFHD